MPHLGLYFLGAPRIELDGVPVEFDRRKAIALIAYLAVTGESHSRDALSTLLWPQYDQRHARAALRSTLPALNKSLGVGWLEVKGEAVGLKRSDDLWMDVDEFHKNLSEHKRHGHEAAEVCPDCVKPLTEAVGLYRGDFLEGFSLQDSVSFDDWQFMETESLRSEMTGALERLVRCHSGEGVGERGRAPLLLSIVYGRRWLEMDRTNEGAHRQLMELYARTGQRAAALRQYEECVRVLEKELSESPHEETVRLYEAIKENLVKVVEPPPLKSTEARRNNLPFQLTSFIGREREMAEVKGLLTTTRLLTLTGSGGCGKTRLMLQVASGLLQEYKDGVWFVEFAPLSDPKLVPQEVAKALDVSEQPSRSLTETLSGFLRSKSLLLLLDNCEHLIAACSELAGVLLRTCPNLKILATSREGLRITGETTWRVPSLSLPHPQLFLSLTQGEHQPLEVSDLKQYEAVQLFIDRAMAALPTFTLTNQNWLEVAQICHRLDGIPLAIELAAALVRSLSVEEIATRLDDRFRLLTGGSRTALPRQRTLLATIEWSYNLLSEAERTLLRRLSVFMGGWTLEAAEAICAGEGIERYIVLDLLTHLVDKSLVVAEEKKGKTRYRFLETVRQYARDRLLESGEAAELRRRHLGWLFMELAEQAESEFRGPNQVAWLERLDVEHDNLRAALEWSLGGGEVEAGLRLAGAIWEFWYVRGYLSEGHQWLERGLAKGSGASALARAKVLNGAGWLICFQGDVDRGIAMVEEGMALFQEAGDKNGMACSLEHLGGMVLVKGNYVRAKALVEEGLALHRKMGNKGGIGRSLDHLGLVAYHQGDYERAKVLNEEGLSLSREAGDKRHTGFALMQLGQVALIQEDYRRAEELLEEALDLFREVKEKVALFQLLRLLADVALHQGDHSRTTMLLEEGLTLCRELGLRRGIAWCLEGFVKVAGARGQLERAARLFGAAEVLSETIDVLPLLAEHADYGRSVAAVRAQLSEGAFKAAWEEGRKMTMEEAISYALEDRPPMKVGGLRSNAP